MSKPAISEFAWWRVRELTVEIRSWNGAARAIGDIWTSASLRGRFARGVVWSLAGTVLSQAGLLLASMVCARVLGPAGFGELAMVNGTIGMFGVFAGFGLGMTATKYVAEFREDDAPRAGRIIALSSIFALAAGGILSLALALGARFVAVATLGAPQLVVEFRVGALLLLLNAWGGAQTGALSGLEAFKAIAHANMLRGLLSLPLTAAGVIWGRVPGAVCGLVVTAGIGCLVNQWALRKECRRACVPIRYRDSISECRVLWDFALPAFLSTALTAPATWAASAVLVRQPNGYTELGIFNAANQWRTALLFLPNVLGQVVVPMLASLQNVSGTRPARRMFFGSAFSNGLCTVPAVALLFPCANWIMSFYGRAFAPRGAILRVVLIAAVLLGLQASAGNLIAAFGRMWTGFFMNAGWAVCFLTVAYVLLMRGWGAQALACAYLAAYAAHAGWTFWFAAGVLRPSPVKAAPCAVRP